MALFANKDKKLLGIMHFQQKHKILQNKNKNKNKTIFKK